MSYEIIMRIIYKNASAPRKITRAYKCVFILYTNGDIKSFWGLIKNILINKLG